MKTSFNGSSTAEEVTEGIDLHGKTFAVTGVNTGLGQETMRVLALRGAHVIGIARTEEKARQACASIPGDTTPLHMDLEDWEEVVQCAQSIRALNTPLDGLITNAGIMALPTLQLVHGVERQFATNHLGHFILINQLMDTVLSAPQGRFVLLSSRAHLRALKGIEFDNLDGSRRYSAWNAYGVSKLANALCARQLARRLAGNNATANSLHPGIIATNLLQHIPSWQQWGARHIVGRLLKTVPEGAATTCYLATHPEMTTTSGGYFANCRPARGSRFLTDDAMAERLWQVSAELTRDYLPQGMSSY